MPKTTVITRRQLLGAGAISLGGLAASCSHRGPVATAGPAPLFQEVASRAGINFQQSNGAVGKFYFIEETGSGCAFFDYNNDGLLDLVIVQCGPYPYTPVGSPEPHCALYRNNGDGTFTDVTDGSGLDTYLGYCQGVTVGDYDNDGYDDLFITAFGGNHLFHNELGSGKFVDVTVKCGLADDAHGPRYGTSAAFGDYNDDGFLDLYVCCYCPWSIAANKTCKTPDGREDYCTPDVMPPASHRLYRNRGDGTFEDVSVASGIDRHKGHGLGVVFLDYDNDGKLDIFVANDLNITFLWHNNGDGTFTNVSEKAGCAYNNAGQEMSGMGIGLGDFDHSGQESLFVGNFSMQPNTLFKNLGNGQFLDVSNQANVAIPHMHYVTFGADFIDYDADGWLDLVTANGHVTMYIAETSPGITYREPRQLFHNNGNGTFSVVTDRLGALSVPMVSRGLAVGDYDNDGRLDFAVVNQNDPIHLYHNEVNNGNNAIILKTVGTKSNRNGFHAKLTLTAGALRLFSTVHSSSSYLSFSDSRVFFGLGKAAMAESLVIDWPSGNKETVYNMRAGSIYTLTEGHGITGQQAFSKRLATT